MMNYGDGMQWWGFAIMAVGTILFWALVIGGIVALVRYTNRSTPPAAPTARATAEQVLGERYARGEIDDDEYQRRLRVLRGEAVSAGI